MFESLTREQLEDRFRYHPPSEEGVARHEALSASFIATAELVTNTCPDGREKALALTALETAKFWGSAAVARNPKTR